MALPRWAGMGVGNYYNHLDLPRRITLSSGDVIEITYDATGRKWLQKKGTTGQIYAGSVVLTGQNSPYRLEAASVSDGRLVYDPEDQELFTEFFHKDHLGNVRVAFTDRNEDGKVELLGPTSEITQQNDYYPFGLRQEGDSLVFHQELSANRYRYNGKELNEELELYDYGARWYDPAVGRWNAVDPLASDYAAWSPYNYVLGNPIMYIDPDGMRVNPSNLIQSDEDNETDHHKNLISDLYDATGITIGTGEDGNWVIESVDESIGSEIARDLLTSLITDTENKIDITANHGNGNGARDSEILYDGDEVGEFVNNFTGGDERSMGAAMVFLHESLHTDLGGGLGDVPEHLKEKPEWHGGETVGAVNEMRDQLGYTRRRTYRPVTVTTANGTFKVLPFSDKALDAATSGRMPEKTSAHTYKKVK